MKVLCNILLRVAVLCALLTTAACAVGEDITPPLASYNYGVTGEPAKIDTAFGNLGEVGPSYDVPSINVTSAEEPDVTSSPISENIEIVMNRNKTQSEGTGQPQVTNASSNPTSPIQSFNTSNTSTSTLTSTTTEKSIVHNTTPKSTVNGSASTASDRGTTAPIDMSMAETEAATNASPAAIPGGTSATPSQTFETGESTRKPTAGPRPNGNATKPHGQNGTATDEPNFSVVVHPYTTIYCLGSVVLLIAMY